MKSNAIIRIIIWSIVLIFLVGVLTAFVADELYLNDYSAGTVPLVEAEATGAKHLANEEKLVVDGNSVDALEIEWAAGDIMILPADVQEITISESDVTDEKYTLVWELEERKLEIRFSGENWNGFGINFAEDFSKDLHICVPADWNCRSLEIDAASATVEIRDMAISKLDLDGTSGIVRLENCDIGDLDIDTASGDVAFSGMLDTLDFDAASAGFTAEFFNTPSRLDMDGMSGKMDISLPEDCGYALSMDGMSTNFRSDFHHTESHNGIYTYGDGRCRIRVDGMNCDVIIRKAA